MILSLQHHIVLSISIIIIIQKHSSLRLILNFLNIVIISIHFSLVFNITLFHFYLDFVIIVIS